MAKKKKFNDFAKMAEHIRADPRMQNEVILINGAAITTEYIRKCLDQFASYEVRILIGGVSPLERLAVELLMETFSVDYSRY